MKYRVSVVVETEGKPELVEEQLGWLFNKTDLCHVFGGHVTMGTYSLKNIPGTAHVQRLEETSNGVSTSE